MQYRQLGRSGLYIAPLSLGSWLTAGMGVADDEAHRILDRAYAAGINFFDTANVYNQGQAEEVIGRWLASQDRSRVIIGTKVFFPMSDHPMDRGLSLRHIHHQAEASLHRLQTDYLDLYQCHRYDPTVPLEETCFAMNQLIQQGWVLHWGVSQWTSVQIVNAIRICERNGWRKPISNQPIYNLLNRSLEVDVMGTCQDEGLGLVVYSPLAQGILTGKYKPGVVPEGSRAANEAVNSFFSFKRLNDTSYRQLDELGTLAAKLGISVAQLSLAWTLRYPAVTSAIVGASRVEQLDENLKAADVALSAETLAEIERIMGNAPRDQYTETPTGYAVTHGKA